MISIKHFDREQFTHFKKVEKERFGWQTKNSYIADKEKEILNVLDFNKAGCILEVGCGEGANLFNMHFKGKAIGLDYSFNRLKFAKEDLAKDVTLICGNAIELPFLDSKFNLVFSRDLLHHLSSPKEAIAEMVRVCKEKGHLVIIEMNGKSNLIGRIFASLIKEERGMKKIDVNQIFSVLIESGAQNIRIVMKQPLLFYRAVFHYTSPLRHLTKIRILTIFLDFIENLAVYLVPKQKWGYIVILADKSHNNFEK